jgi:hypothetical protein
MESPHVPSSYSGLSACVPLQLDSAKEFGGAAETQVGSIYRLGFGSDGAMYS